jgi:hypothetical protein
VGGGSTPVLITDDSETCRLYKLESELVGGSCGARDRDGVSKNCPNKLGSSCWTV